LSIKAPYLPYEEIENIAQSFLKIYHPTFKLPIPIEHIIEFGLDLDIIPMENLYRIFKQNGFLSADRTAIYIDDYQYDNFVEKYRFTLAHEVGHYTMHKALYENLKINSVEEYIDFLKSIPRKELFWFESQGDSFAGHLLVPTKELESACINLIKANNIQFSDGYQPSLEFWSYASNDLVEIFEVNPKVIEIRINKEGLVGKFDHYFKKDN
jgi:IrrE N-terminal-like domain